MADEARQISRTHQKWIVDALREAPEHKATYHHIVEEGEKHQCDTVGAMLKILKNRKVIGYKEAFLMYPMHKDEVITLVNVDYDPLTAE